MVMNSTAWFLPERDSLNKTFPTLFNLFYLRIWFSRRWWILKRGSQTTEVLQDNTTVLGFFGFSVVSLGGVLLFGTLLRPPRGASVPSTKYWGVGFYWGGGTNSTSVAAKLGFVFWMCFLFCTEHPMFSYLGTCFFFFGQPWPSQRVTSIKIPKQKFSFDLGGPKNLLIIRIKTHVRIPVPPEIRRFHFCNCFWKLIVFNVVFFLKPYQHHTKLFNFLLLFLLLSASRVFFLLGQVPTQACTLLLFLLFLENCPKNNEAEDEGHR